MLPHALFRPSLFTYSHGILVCVRTWWMQWYAHVVRNKLISTFILKSLISSVLESNSRSSTLESNKLWNTEHTRRSSNIAFNIYCVMYTSSWKQSKIIDTTNNYYVILIYYFIKCKWTLLVKMSFISGTSLRIIIALLELKIHKLQPLLWNILHKRLKVYYF